MLKLCSFFDFFDNFSPKLSYIDFHFSKYKFQIDDRDRRETLTLLFDLDHEDRLHDDSKEGTKYYKLICVHCYCLFYLILGLYETLYIRYIDMSLSLSYKMILLDFIALHRKDLKYLSVSFI